MTTPCTQVCCVAPSSPPTTPTHLHQFIHAEKAFAQGARTGPCRGVACGAGGLEEGVVFLPIFANATWSCALQPSAHPTPPHTTPVHSGPLCPASHLLIGVHPFLCEWFTHRAPSFGERVRPLAALVSLLGGAWPTVFVPTGEVVPASVRVVPAHHVQLPASHLAVVAKSCSCSPCVCVLCAPALARSRQPEAQWVPAGRDHGFCPAPLAHVVRGHRPLVGSRLRVTRTSLGVHALKFMSLAI